jgi:hypothetical protein
VIAFRRSLVGLIAAVALGTACTSQESLQAGLAPAGPGSLALSVRGLPAGTPAAISVSTAEGFQHASTGPETIPALAPGSYLIAASEVVADGDRYHPTPISQTINVTPGSAASAEVAYGLITARLQITVSGVSPDNGAALLLSGPGYSKTLSGTTMLTGLTPGVYLLQTPSLLVNGDRYRAASESREILLAVPDTVPVVVSVAYALASGRLTVAVSGVPAAAAAVRVSGPGLDHLVTQTETLVGLEPGTYGLAATPISAGGQSYLPTPASQSASVAAGATTAATVSYAPSGPPITLDLTLNGAYLTQAAQRYDGSVPLVAGRDAYLRVFAIANQPNSVHATVRVRFYVGGTLQQTYGLTAAAANVPVSVDESSLSQSWNVRVPGALIQPGLKLLADVDPANTVAESVESNNQFPGSGSAASIDVRSLPTFALRFVPVLQQVNGLQGNVTSGNQEEFLSDLKKMLPVGAYDVDRRAPYTTTAPVLQDDNGNLAWGTVLSELLALRSADASPRYYYGVVKTAYGSGMVGIGYIGGSARTAMGWDYLPSGTNVMAHEVGHNMGRLHAPCGDPVLPDPGYPHPGAQTGVWGMDVTSLTLKPPTLPDLMSYCGPSWIGDYNWAAMLAYRQSGPSNVSDAGSGPTGLLIWGRITADGVVLEPAFRVPAAPALAPRAGENRLELLATDGTLLRSVSFEAPEVADLPAGPERHFAFVLPFDTAQQPVIGAFRVVSGSRSAIRLAAAAATADPSAVVRRATPQQIEVRWDAARFPMVLVRDAASRQVLSFARGGSARIWSTGEDVELQFSDGVRSTTRAVRVLR